jgi:hypothetical protein
MNTLILFHPLLFKFVMIMSLTLCDSPTQQYFCLINSFNFRKLVRRRASRRLAGTVHGKADRPAVNILICVGSSGSVRCVAPKGKTSDLCGCWCSVVESRLAFRWPKGQRFARSLNLSHPPTPLVLHTCSLGRDRAEAVVLGTTLRGMKLGPQPTTADSQGRSQDSQGLRSQAGRGRLGPGLGLGAECLGDCFLQTLELGLC